MTMTNSKVLLIFCFAFYETCSGVEKQSNMQSNITPANIQIDNSNKPVIQSDSQKIENKEWLTYEPTIVELKGKLVVKTFFGPPNFGENPKTDTKDRSWILSLDKPINVRATSETDPILGPSIENVGELQLVLQIPHRKFIGKKIIVKGTLFHAHTGHHHTDVLMDVQSISLVPLD